MNGMRDIYAVELTDCMMLRALKILRGPIKLHVQVFEANKHAETFWTFVNTCTESFNL